MSQLLKTLKQWCANLWVLAFVFYPIEVTVFAVLYSRLPEGSFAQMTAQMDPSYLEALRRAEDDLALEMKTAISMSSSLRELARRQELGEDYNIRMRLRPANGPGYGNFAALITIGKKDSQYGGDLEFRLAGGPDGSSVAFFRDCRDCPNETLLVPTGVVELPVSEELYGLLAQVSLQQRNWLIRGWDFFDRFLYYSAITSTTLGYGDIVPLRGWARALSAVQSFISIVLFGLLVNALWLAVGPQAKTSNKGDSET